MTRGIPARGRSFVELNPKHKEQFTNGPNIIYFYDLFKSLNIYTQLDFAPNSVCDDSHSVRH